MLSFESPTTRSEETNIKSPAVGEEKTSDSTPGSERSHDTAIGEIGPVGNIKPFSLLSLLATAFACSNAPVTLLASLTAGIASGGPFTMIYGTIIVGAASVCVAVSLGELASAMPHAGGQYYWATQLAPRRYRRGLSYLTAFLSWAGAVVTCASCMLTVPLMVLGIMVLRNPDMIIKPWMVFVGYQLTNIFCFLVNCFERILPPIANANLAVALALSVSIFISLLAASPTKQSGEFVFATFVNNSGWSNKGITFLSGLVAANWGFSCLDAITHLADEVPEPAKNIPKALLATVLLSISTALPIGIATFFSVQSLDDAVSTPTGLPSLEIFYQCLGSIKGAVALEAFMTINYICAGVSIQTWQSRLAWALACDQGWPFSKSLSHIARQPFNVPIWANLWSCIWVALLGCLYLGSAEAFNAFIGGGILLQYISYSACVIMLLYHGRNNITPGPFWWPKFGPIANVVTIAWTVLTLVFYSFPASYPPTAGTMNYVSVVIVFMFVYSGAFWLVQGRKEYVLPAEQS
jgi:choline transport protein